MSQNLTISETGLKLIKAFEGFRPVDRELITGQRIVGYGHRLYSEDAVMMNKAEASDVLKSDLEPFEDMINTEVHAPMSQSQFDALCSFAFNIGPKAFLQSDTLRAMNNGRPLDAANGLDIWRKSVIDGKTYVVDALMRRRTAEKALFLRTGSAVPAGREDLPPVKDDIMTGLTTDDGLPVFTESDANGIVATAPYSAYDAPARRREDGPAGALQLSERDIIEEDEFVEEEIFEDGSAEDGLGLDLNLDLDLDLDLGAEESGSFSLPEDNLEDLESLENVKFLKAETSNDAPDAATADEKRKSPIAAAATDIVARLDALIDDADVRFDDTKESWPVSLVDTATSDYLDETENDIYSSETTEDGLRNNVIDLNPETSRESDALGETLAQRIMHGREAPLSESNVDVSIIDADETLNDETVNNGPVPVIDELAQDDVFRQRSDSAAKYIETSSPAHFEPQKVKQGGAALWMPIIIGFILVGVACGAMFRGSELLLGQWGPIISFTGFVIGAGLILSGLYATLRINLSR